MNKLRQHFNRQMKNERGAMLIITYFVIAILVTLAATTFKISMNEARMAERQFLTVNAFHIAEAGIERALYDLRLDFVNAMGTPSWADGDINGMAIGPDSSNYYSIPYSASSRVFNGGSYEVDMKNDNGGDDVWLRSVGEIGGVEHTIEVYVKTVNLSPWDNAIFAGAGASGTMVNGNVDIRGSVHILGSGLNTGDYAVDLGGTAELVGNNYKGLDASLEIKVPPLPTTSVNGETVETLNAELRVKKGLVGLSGSSTVGEADVYGNDEKETVDNVYVTDGWGGNKGAASVYSDNGTSNAYDLGNSVSFPSLSDPYGGQANYRDYLVNVLGAHVVTNTTDLAALENIKPNSNFLIADGAGNSIRMDGSGNMTVTGIVVIDPFGSYSGDMHMSKQGSNKTITYSGTGTIYAAGDVQINTNLVTNGTNSFPNNIMAIMTPNHMDFNEAGIDAMGLFYAENTISVQKQTDIMGTIVSNYFDMGTNVPSIYQVPDTVNNLPGGLIGSNAYWYLVVAWLKM